MSQESKFGTPFKRAESFLRRANIKRQEAKDHLKDLHYPEAVSASQECLELSMKAVFLMCGKRFPRKHELSEEEAVEALNNVPEEVRWRNFPRLFLLQQFWADFYTLAKYGYDLFSVGPETLFEGEEARLAIKHADDCYLAADHVRQVIHREQLQ